jgi:ferredoxin
MCGKRWPANGQESVVIKKNRRESVMEKSPSGKVGICVNCEREKFIAGADGLCSTCHRAVRGMSPSATDYYTTLENVKLRLTNSFNGRIGKKTKRDTQNKSKPTTKSTLDMTVKKVAKTGIPGIIQCMRDEQESYLLEAEKLGKAINILESIKP